MVVNFLQRLVMSKRFRFYPSEMLRKKPRPLKTTIKVRDNYIDVSVKFTNGQSSFYGFPSRSPYYSAILAKQEIINEQVKLFNENKSLRKIGNSFILR